ncbi:hypothetical protein LPUS_11089 [Lasallia pustulata]|uniref:Azaphilone pigments biosynthesis cluster protein L N-terminal domain-containing protein n=1 Tax=Lasallia pustulata TaxID=136370 RepID=A0A1W5DAY7_9LECA|nr:hypothetical protein LPUS_11089 [Lasallia pustulata]
MTDPLSIAASVASLVAFAGAISKEVFQFFSSIKNAPENARVLVSALYSLNVTLGQVQTNLLDSRFVADHDGEDFKALNVCLVNCTAILSELERKVQKSGLGEATKARPTRLRDAVQWSYTDDEIAEYLRRVEAEKGTLSIALEAFTM